MGLNVNYGNQKLDGHQSMGRSFPELLFFQACQEIGRQFIFVKNQGKLLRV